MIIGGPLFELDVCVCCSPDVFSGKGDAVLFRINQRCSLSNMLFRLDSKDSGLRYCWSDENWQLLDVFAVSSAIFNTFGFLASFLPNLPSVPLGLVPLMINCFPECVCVYLIIYIVIFFIRCRDGGMFRNCHAFFTESVYTQVIWHCWRKFLGFVVYLSLFNMVLSSLFGSLSNCSSNNDLIQFGVGWIAIREMLDPVLHHMICLPLIQLTGFISVYGCPWSTKTLGVCSHDVPYTRKMKWSYNSF